MTTDHAILRALNAELVAALERMLNHGHDSECEYHHINGRCSCGADESYALLAKAREAQS